MTATDTLTKIRKALQSVDPKDVAFTTGLTTRQIKNIRDDHSANPTWSTMTAIAAFLKIRL